MAASTPSRGGSQQHGHGHGHGHGAALAHLPPHPVSVYVRARPIAGTEPPSVLPSTDDPNTVIVRALAARAAAAAAAAAHGARGSARGRPAPATPAGAGTEAVGAAADLKSPTAAAAPVTPVAPVAPVAPVTPAALSDQRLPVTATFGGDTSQKQVYERVGAPLLRHALTARGGAHAVVLCHGAVGHGKSWTCFGGGQSPAEQGLLPRLVQGLFRHVTTDTTHWTGVTVSVYDVHTDALRDLGKYALSPFHRSAAALAGSVHTPSSATMDKLKATDYATEDLAVFTAATLTAAAAAGRNTNSSSSSSKATTAARGGAGPTDAVATDDAAGDDARDDSSSHAGHSATIVIPDLTRVECTSAAQLLDVVRCGVEARSAREQPPRSGSVANLAHTVVQIDIAMAERTAPPGAVQGTVPGVAGANSSHSSSNSSSSSRRPRSRTSRIVLVDLAGATDAATTPATAAATGPSSSSSSSSDTATLRALAAARSDHNALQSMLMQLNALVTVNQQQHLHALYAATGNSNSSSSGAGNSDSNGASSSASAGAGGGVAPAPLPLLQQRVALPAHSKLALALYESLSSTTSRIALVGCVDPHWSATHAAHATVRFVCAATPPLTTVTAASYHSGGFHKQQAALAARHRLNALAGDGSSEGAAAADELSDDVGVLQEQVTALRHALRDAHARYERKMRAVMEIVDAVTAQPSSLFTKPPVPPDTVAALAAREFEQQQTALKAVRARLAFTGVDNHSNSHSNSNGRPASRGGGTTDLSPRRPGTPATAGLQSPNSAKRATARPQSAGSSRPFTPAGQRAREAAAAAAAAQAALPTASEIALRYQEKHAQHTAAAAALLAIAMAAAGGTGASASASASTSAAAVTATPNLQRRNSFTRTSGTPATPGQPAASDHSSSNGNHSSSNTNHHTQLLFGGASAVAAQQAAVTRRALAAALDLPAVYGTASNTDKLLAGALHSHTRMGELVAELRSQLAHARTRLADETARHMAEQGTARKRVAFVEAQLATERELTASDRAHRLDGHERAAADLRAHADRMAASHAAALKRNADRVAAATATEQQLRTALAQAQDALVRERQHWASAKRTELQHTTDRLESLLRAKHDELARTVADLHALRTSSSARVTRLQTELTAVYEYAARLSAVLERADRGAFGVRTRFGVKALNNVPDPTTLSSDDTSAAADRLQRLAVRSKQTAPLLLRTHTGGAGGGGSSGLASPLLSVRSSSAASATGGGSGGGPVVSGGWTFGVNSSRPGTAASGGGGGLTSRQDSSPSLLGGAGAGNAKSDDADDSDSDTNDARHNHAVARAAASATAAATNSAQQQQLQALRDDVARYEALWKAECDRHRQLRVAFDAQQRVLSATGSSASSRPGSRPVSRPGSASFSRTTAALGSHGRNSSHQLMVATAAPAPATPAAACAFRPSSSNGLASRATAAAEPASGSSGGADGGGDETKQHDGLEAQLRTAILGTATAPAPAPAFAAAAGAVRTGGGSRPSSATTKRKPSLRDLGVAHA